MALWIGLGVLITCALGASIGIPVALSATQTITTTTTTAGNYISLLLFL